MFNRISIKIISLTLIIVIMFTLTSCQGDNSVISDFPTDEQIAEQHLTKTEITVWGLTCYRCARQISDTVSSIDGVVGVFVDVKTETVIVAHDANIDVDTIKQSIIADGYSMP